MAYEAFRKDGGPTLYHPNKNAVTADVTEWGFIYAAIILAISLLVILPGARGKSKKIFYLVKVVIGVFVTAAIMLCQFGQEWERAHVKSKTQYKAGISEEVTANIGVKIGLRSINITLKGDPVEQHLNNITERIDYNERFSWNNEGWTLGRIGFGPFAGRFNQEFRDAQYKGLPYPILWIAEYFTIDGEGIRWGRFYLQAGFYTHALVWTAFPTWVVAMVLMYMVLFYGGLFTAMTGGFLVLGNILYASIRNRNDLVIPFEEGHLMFSWGPTFWLCLFTGVFCIILGVVIMVLDLYFQEKLYKFFGFNIVKNLEEYYETVDVDHSGATANGGTPTASTSGESGTRVQIVDDDDIYVNPGVNQTRRFRARTQLFSKRFGPKGQYTRKKPMPTPRGGGGGGDGGNGVRNPAYDQELQNLDRSARPTIRPPPASAAVTKPDEVVMEEDDDADYENWGKDNATYAN